MPLSTSRAADADPQSGPRLSPEVGAKVEVDAIDTVERDDAVDDEVDVGELVVVVVVVVVVVMETAGDAVVGGTAGEAGVGSRGVGCGGSGDGAPVPSHAMATWPHPGRSAVG